ncbi:fatty acyl-CoA reductase wat-like [Harmonia axyridis]|uniref:fatty acyl-CoA reductase wat-like n=1 Tax=Harmonia axyridis TaxID=115357 RepID=UPI001E278F62|nr:fatty acyl-CoA reductase wat-like [Harmonia axyridis]XP_045467336.1 fatty acyl-CoA reductase wat-like [Harmonia axyridis]
MTTSQILEFYENTNVFITGGTGFLGKLLIEKLLRSTSVSTLYLLVRPKKSKDIATRITNIFEDVIFEKLHKECPKFMNRIVTIHGDISLPDLGISKTDRQMLVEKVNIIFHVAATMRFDENLKIAYCVNVKGAQGVLNLGKNMKYLKCAMHVSTAYSNAYLDLIEEKFYDHPLHYEEVGGMLETMTESEADKHTKRIIGGFPNTYCFTKALAESMIRDTSDKIPIGVFRPSIVISTNKEPIKGWVDNLYGPIGLSVVFTLGLLKVIFCDSVKKANIVPGDMCVAALIAAAWDSEQKQRRQGYTKEIPIYNYVSMENTLTWGEFCDLLRINGQKFPHSKILWTIGYTFTGNIYFYMIIKIFYHMIPAIIIDVIGMLFFKNLGMWKTYDKIHKASYVVSFFSLREWKFSNNNIEKLWNKLDDTEKNLFFFDMNSLDLWMFYKNYVLGIRKYALKDSLDSLEAAKRKLRILWFLHNILLFLLYFTMSVLVWTVFRKFKGVQQLCGDIN